MEPNSPSAQTRRKVEEWVEEFINSHPPGTLLPPDNHLAHRFGLSRTTIRKHLRQMVQSLLYDLSQGKIKQGQPFPPIQTLCIQNKAASLTVRKAFALLEKRGQAIRRGKRYWAMAKASLRYTNTRPTVSILYPQSLDLNRFFNDKLIAMNFRKMESELSNHGRSFSFHTYLEAEENFKYWKQKNPPDGVVVLGEMNGRVTGKNLQWFKNLWKKHPLAKGNSQVPVLFITKNAIHKHPGWFFFSTSHIITTTERTLAVFLADKKAGKAFYFAYEREMLRFNPLRLLPELDRWNPSCSLKFCIHSYASANNDSLIREKIFCKYHEKKVGERITKYGKSPAGRFENMVLFHAHPEDFFPSLPRPAFWIFSRDEDAILAKNWCRARSLKVPGDVSILGLENTSVSLPHGITSCVPDWETNGYLMAQVILRYAPVARTSRGFIHCNSRVIYRQTA